MERFHTDEALIPERYILGELSAEEAEAFELHYFECQQCAMAVESATLFAANARAVFQQPIAKPVAKKSWRPNFSWALPMAAAFALAILAVYQNAVTIPQLRQPRALPAFQLIGASRGEGAQVSVPAGTTSFALAADVPPDARFPTYICELSEAGRAIFTVQAPAPAEGQPITILVPLTSLSPGPHTLTILGGQPATKVSSYTFDLRIVH